MELYQIEKQKWLVWSYDLLISYLIMGSEINFRILETIEACQSIHALEQEEENHISIKELLILEEIYG